MKSTIAERLEEVEADLITLEGSMSYHRKVRARLEAQVDALEQQVENLASDVIALAQEARRVG